MAWSKLDSILSIVMIGSGIVIVLGPRWLALQKVQGFAGNSKEHSFVHTFLLATLKFGGELVCLLIYGIWFWRSVNMSQGRGPRYPRDPVGRANARLVREEDEGLLQDGGGAQENDGADQPLLGHRPPREARPVHERPRPANPNWPPPIQDPNHFNIALFVLPALFDLASQALLFVGLKLTYKDSYFMLRGATLFFTALLSVAFMARPLQIQMWVGLSCGILGCVCMGIRPYIHPGNEANDGFDAFGIAAGDLLIVMSFIMNATQAVYEEKFVTKHRINPLLAVGLEGLFGFVVSFFLTIAFSFVNAGAFSHLPHHHLEDPIDAFYQMSNSWQVSLMVIGCILAAPLYTFCGISIGKMQGAMARMVIDTFKTLVFFYILFLAMHKTSFYFPQIIGVFLILAGIVIFNQFYDHIYRAIRGLPPREDELLQNTMVPLGPAPGAANRGIQ